LIASEKASGKIKYSTQAAASITEIKYLLINSAIADSKTDRNAIEQKSCMMLTCLTKLIL
jgi:hypothetical protein